MSAILYDYWRSTASYRVRIALNLAGIAYRSVPIDLIGGEQSGPDHLARNPQGFVPVFEIDGLRLTQSLAIIEYLDETRGLGLLPANPAERARVRRLSLTIAADTHPICNPSVVKVVLGRLPGDTRDEARVDWMRHFIRRGLMAFEAMLGEPPTGRFCHGDTPTLADLCLIPQIYNADRWGAGWSDLPRIQAVADAAGEIGAFRAASPEAVNQTG
ncbi:maleylacetoacetate isomerase [Citreimonas salinaria]|uniref:Maleylacetoacetate isomerase n=1 Tax=Citreimonas salinaria TaxID=321339 RepID=A0A1H3FGV2_9RHOB|nr:maleylacetoacetate isomerase [Citreimonas salinaria]SDX90160.1 maleylacetoacetate isomerase [Citreimonas salinaria]